MISRIPETSESGPLKGEGQATAGHAGRADQAPADSCRHDNCQLDPVGRAGDGPTAHAATTAGAETWRGEQIMIHQQRPTPLWGDRTAVTSCWMCGIRLPANQMVADGGSTCLDLRWYCRDTLGCTERWTSRSARSAAIRQSMAETSKTSGKQATDADVAQPVSA